MTDTPHESERTIAILHRMSEGDAAAGDELYDLLYQELHRRAKVIARGHGTDHTLQATALVNEAWLRLAGQSGTWKDRAHFLRVAARAMRYALVDHARARGAAKRGGAVPPLPETAIGEDHSESALTLLAIHEAMERLEHLDEGLFRVAELRIFGGLTHEESARVLGISSRTIDRTWKSAQAWLRSELAKGEESGA